MTWKEAFNLKTVTVGVACSVLATILIATVISYWQWVNSGGMIRALGGVTNADAVAIVKANLPPAVPPTEWKLELISGTGASEPYKGDDGAIVAVAAANNCPQGSVLVNAFCTTNKLSVSAGVLRGGGLEADGSFACVWTGVDKPPQVFGGQAQAMCLRLVKK